MTGADDKPVDEPEERFTLPEGPVQEKEREADGDGDEELPPDFVMALLEFMEDVCRIEAHVWAANIALRRARAKEGDELAEGSTESVMWRERAHYLIGSVANAASEAAWRVHETWPEVLEYCVKNGIGRRRETVREE